MVGDGDTGEGVGATRELSSGNGGKANARGTGAIPAGSDGTQGGSPIEGGTEVDSPAGGSTSGSDARARGSTGSGGTQEDLLMSWSGSSMEEGGAAASGGDARVVHPPPGTVGDVPPQGCVDSQGAAEKEDHGKAAVDSSGAQPVAPATSIQVGQILPSEILVHAPESRTLPSCLNFAKISTDFL